MQEDHCTYESSHDRPLTPEEIKRYKDAFYAPPAQISVYEKIDLRFSQSALVRIEVIRDLD